MTQISFAPVKTRFIRITQTAGAKDKYWSMVELNVLEATRGMTQTVLAKNTRP